MSKIGQHIQEQQEKEGWDGISDRPSDPPVQQENEHAKLIRQKWPMGGWPTKSDDHKS